jgi:cytochrome c-type biogenesis protein CcmH
LKNTPKAAARPLLANLRWSGTRWLQMAAVIAVALMFLGAGDSLESRFNTLGHKKLICPCGCNQILLECNHVGCTYSDTMRNELMTALGRGDSDDLVLQAFVQKYGPTVLAAPTTTGFNIVAWITPFAVLIAGFVFAGLIISSWKTRPLAEPEPVASAVRLDEFREQARRETEL